MTRNKDVLTGQENYRGEHTEEDIEYYDMSYLESKLFKRLGVLEDKMDAILEEVEDNNNRLKSIQFQFTRQTILRVLKWAIILGLVYFFYTQLVEPIVSQFSGMYYEQTGQDSGDAGSIFQNILDMFPNMGNALDDVRPGTDTASSTVEN